MPQLKLSYKIFMEAEDISQSRIISGTSFVKNRLENQKNPYISRVCEFRRTDLAE